MPYFFASASTPRMRRTATWPYLLCNCRHNAPMCFPVFSARFSNCCVDNGVRRGPVLVVNAMTPTFLSEVLTEQLPGDGIQQADVGGVPLHLNASADPTRRRAVIGGLHFDAAVQVHRAFAILVITKRFERQRKQSWLLFSKHCRNLPLGGSVNARVGPPRFPVVQIRLSLFEALEALPFERRLFRMPDAGFNFAFAIRVPHSAWKRSDAVVLQYIAVQRIACWIVNVRREHALAEIIEHHHTSGPTDS